MPSKRFLFCLSLSPVGRRSASWSHKTIIIYPRTIFEFYFLRTTNYESPCPSRSIRSHQKSSKTSRSTPWRASHSAPHVSWRRSCSSIDDCIPPSRARRTRTSTRASLRVNSTMPRSFVDSVPERLRPGNWRLNCEGGACSLPGCVTGLDVRWVS